jgi:hypothetical protein
MLVRSYYNELKSSFPEAFKVLNDKFEGVAYYVEMRTKAVHKNGCDADADTIAQAVNSLLVESTSQHVGFKNSPYILNALASFALDLGGEPQWKNAVETTTATPLDLLLSKVSAAPLQQVRRDRDAGLLLAKCLAR